MDRIKIKLRDAEVSQAAYLIIEGNIAKYVDENDKVILEWDLNTTPELKEQWNLNDASDSSEVC